ncbi:MAG: hypothetical protein J0G96_14680 [Flavobacteriia bacterium]|nr:hypothetical protein [Flavobacteriia bacterium]OJX39088.1 MAG: hypothetical protein BGO87_03620 [Flavobacteriia bacterium 40-80]
MEEHLHLPHNEEEFSGTPEKTGSNFIDVQYIKNEIDELTRWIRIFSFTSIVLLILNLVTNFWSIFYVKDYSSILGMIIGVVADIIILDKLFKAINSFSKVNAQDDLGSLLEGFSHLEKKFSITFVFSIIAIILFAFSLIFLITLIP